MCAAYDCYALGQELYAAAENYGRAREWMLEALARLSPQMSTGLATANGSNSSSPSALPQTPSAELSAQNTGYTATVALALDGQSTISLAVVHDELSTLSESNSATANHTRLNFAERTTRPEWDGSESDFRKSIIEYIAFSDYQVHIDSLLHI